MAQYCIFIADSDQLGDPDITWFRPSEIRRSWHDVEPSLDFANKAERFYRNMFGLLTKREEI